MSDGGGVDLSSNDEIKVFHDEGEREDEERSSSENLKEVKSSLVAEVPDEEVAPMFCFGFFLVSRVEFFFAEFSLEMFQFECKKAAIYFKFLLQEKTVQIPSQSFIPSRNSQLASFSPLTGEFFKNFI